nr:immunoglobulin light chain junction region [Macaca mulatta]MOV66449.1 immunoglobulin light chain junction region [Macaca mulatta]MOV66924.1 immunoglobulin light chain junction region [Macaca mulatta]MOV67123.1 immunoglobulin light chain junction region [Macaca mulatta]MOV67238.1 immunoglobulin light chain junction region [Macaca mulatta]
DYYCSSYAGSDTFVLF